MWKSLLSSKIYQKTQKGFKAIKDARPLLILGDMVTTDHISPAGNIQKESPTGEYFMEHQISAKGL